jgi:hypothetical protein
VTRQRRSQQPARTQDPGPSERVAHPAAAPSRVRVRFAGSVGFVTVPLAGFLIFLVLKHTSQTAQVLVVYVITWFLLLSGVRWMLHPAVHAPVR